ncbi:MAG: hypothetical protein RKP20_13170 [Candidatus Competibacter sp.]|nr:hypothetical protein [Candidatus Contendobacter sp.]MDS4042119.1 hypothetical protein [Candidatus Competibacter sp.]
MALLDQHELAVARDRDARAPLHLAELVKDDRFLDVIEAAHGQHDILDAVPRLALGERVEHHVGGVEGSDAANAGLEMKPVAVSW